MNNFHVIYHFWSLNKNFSFFKDIYNPIILSIATWRLHNKDIPITVLDVSPVYISIDWDYFSNLLNFNVVKHKPFIEYNRLTSRTWDIWECANKVPEENIIFNDADVFWLKDPFPLEKQKTNGCLLEGLHCGGNTGVFYFNKNSQLTRILVELWKKKSFEAISGHPDIKEYNKKYHNGNVINDEIIYEMLRGKYKNLYKNMSFSDCENFQFFNSYFYFLKNKKIYLNYKKNIPIKNIHALTAAIKNKKMFFIFIKELNNVKELFPKIIWENFFSEEDFEKNCKLKINKLSISEFAALPVSRVFDYLRALDFNYEFLL